VGLRTGTSDAYSIVDLAGRLIGTVDAARAFETVYPGAIYLHQGQQHRVERLDLEDKVAWVEAVTVDEYTQARSTIDFAIIAVESAVDVGRATLHLGPLEVTEQVVGYQRYRLHDGEDLGRVELDLPPSTLTTRAFWYTIPPGVLGAARVSPSAAPGALHAAEHAGIGMLPLFTICDRWDVGGVSTVWQADTGLPTIVIYDGYPGGAGIAELGFAAGRTHLAATLEAIESCPCATGCPSCVQSPKCGNGNDPLDKAGAVRLLRAILAD
jgi:DEAD/DEAH box helicase domain-containing protein